MAGPVIRLAHSPDSDDAFMFYALAKGLLDTEGLVFIHELQDIQSLNERALRAELEVTAVSFHAYAFLSDRYLLLPHGASFGDGYGPMVVSKEPRDVRSLRGLKVAVPGRMTSAFLALRLVEPDVEPVFMGFDAILPAVRSGEVPAGLIIHEGQLTYFREGVHLVVDLGVWWKGRTGLPLPLGGNVIRKDLGPERVAQVSRLLKASIAYSLSHREEALDYAMTFGRGLSRKDADTFVGMYVNEWTLDYGEAGRRAVRLFLDEAFEKGLLPHRPVVEFAP
ncbi:MAG: menaquinone biosynthesis family protein [Acidobacteriota bacterium]